MTDRTKNDKKLNTPDKKTVPDLKDIREKLDETDRLLVKAFEERLRLCDDVAEYKLLNNRAVLDTKREEEKLEAIRALIKEETDIPFIEETFRHILTLSRRYQYEALNRAGVIGEPGFSMVEELPLKEDSPVVYQGSEGAYSHMAASAFFPEGVRLYHVPSFEEAVGEIENGNASYAVIPIENSEAGAVTDTYDLLMKHEVYIVGGYIQSVSHKLLGLEEAGICDIKTVYSHPQGLWQCSEFLAEHRSWQQIGVSNTAVAAKSVACQRDISRAAIASELAGRLNGLKILESDISNDRNNATRFVILCRDRIFKKGSDRISIIFELPHKAGTLYNILSNFMFNNINMIKIESRPISGRPWEYRFFIDIEGSLADSYVRNALAVIEKEAENLRILGNY